jgi:predicted transposase YdaD
MSAAREEGLEKGREEGKLAGRIQTLQELLGDKVSSDAELIALEVDELQAQVDTLQQRLRARQV